MISVAQAQALVLEHARPLPPETLPVSSAALGLVLAEEVISDIAMPPFDKAMMDGFAVRSADLAEGRAALTVIEEVTAGGTPRLAVGTGQATRIMTGAPVPAGADAVVMVERTRPLDDGRVAVEDRPSAGQNILPRAREMGPGQVVLRPGAVLRPQEFGLLSTVGRTAVRVHPPPRLALLATGDELVEPYERPGPGQIRNGNTAMLLAQAWRAGALPRTLGIARDDEASLRALISEGLQFHVLVLTGGVSAGKLDLVPGVLAGLGVRAHFHKVVLKPGKPVFFGTRGETLVFGLPGNPVSSMVCFELFVRPAVRRLRGLADSGPHIVQAVLAEEFHYRTDRPTYHPARLEETGDGFRARIVPWFGSPDLRALQSANAFAVLAAGDHKYRAGQRLDVLKVENG
jgi:molybdopterin molybdotransferase